MNTIFDLDKLTQEFEEAEEREDMNGDTVKHVFLGTVFGLTPSGKYYTPFACSNVTDEEIEQDLDWFEQATHELEQIEACLISGDGDPCDLFAEMIIRGGCK